MNRNLSDYFPDAPSIEFMDVKTSSNEIQPHDLFVCIQGVSVDCHDFLPQAALANAAGAIVSKDVNTPLPVYKVANPNETLVELVKKVYPHDQLRLVGVTGTDGKTTISTILGSFLNHLTSAAVIGTNGAFSPNYAEATKNTTPAIEHLYRLLHTFMIKGDSIAIMEAGSEGLHYGRTQGLEFDVSIFSNLTPEHLNTHKTMENYFDAKSMLFKQTKTTGTAIINIDDPYGQAFKDLCRCKVITYGQSESADIRLSNIMVHHDHTSFTIHHLGKTKTLTTNLLGEFNAYNLAATFGAIHALGYAYECVYTKLRDLNVSGRLQRVELGQPFKVLVDYAHTPNGYLSLFKYMKALKMNRLIVVAASAGGRDHDKRPTMGKILSDEADVVVITSEDPRFEDPMDIATMMMRDVTQKNVQVILDRSEAIHRAILMATHDDCILILGKGDENYQVIKDQRIPFNDIDQAKAAILAHPLMKIKK